MTPIRPLLLVPLLLATASVRLLGEGGNPLWQITEPIPLEEPPSMEATTEETSPDSAELAAPTPTPEALNSTGRGALAESGQQIVLARENYRQALAENPNDPALRERYAWFLYANGFHDKECLRLLEQSFRQENASDPVGLFNAVVQVREELGLPSTPLKKPPGKPKRASQVITPGSSGFPKQRFSKDSGKVISSGSPARSGKNVAKEKLESPADYKRWTFTPYYDYSFFNKGRQGWQEEYAQLLYQVNRKLIIGAEIDILQRPPSGTDIYYNALASYYLAKYLEVHGKISICPDPSFAATQIYTGGFIYQMMPKVGLLLDYQRYNFIQGPIDQINPGLVYNFTEETFLTARYVRGWAFYNLEYNYYSAAFNLGLPGKRRLTMAFAYGTDPDAQIGSDGNNITTLSPAYTYSLFFTQPITRDLTLFTGVQYVYRLKESGGELYQQLTPTIGCSLKF
jgi:hypothetical protein